MATLSPLSVLKNTCAVGLTGAATAGVTFACNTFFHNYFKISPATNPPLSLTVQVCSGIGVALASAIYFTSFVDSLIKVVKSKVNPDFWKYHSLQMIVGSGAILSAVLIRLQVIAVQNSYCKDLRNLAIPLGIAGNVLLTPAVTCFGKDWLVVISIIGAIAGCLQSSNCLLGNR